MYFTLAGGKQNKTVNGIFTREEPAGEQQDGRGEEEGRRGWNASAAGAPCMHLYSTLIRGGGVNRNISHYPTRIDIVRRS